MSRGYAIPQTLPFVLPTPVGRKIERVAKKSWAIGLFAATLALGCYHVYQMNVTASKGYTLKNLQIQLDQLNATVSDLDAKSAKMQSLATIQSRVQGLGYVPVGQMEFVDVAHSAYAFAK
ncbi:MAG TPA: hypothetical protein VMU11_00825 [Verrucomicrobiae bacterium]|nr:hypothetical protein [Verrucomicrobiae bacterium]